MVWIKLESFGRSCTRKGESIFYNHRSKLPLKGVGGQVTWLLTTMIFWWIQTIWKSTRCPLSGVVTHWVRSQSKGHLLKVYLTLNKNFVLAVKWQQVAKWVGYLPSRCVSNNTNYRRNYSDWKHRNKSKKSTWNHVNAKNFLCTCTCFQITWRSTLEK